LAKSASSSDQCLQLKFGSPEDFCQRIFDKRCIGPPSRGSSDTRQQEHWSTENSINCVICLIGILSANSDENRMPTGLGLPHDERRWVSAEPEHQHHKALEDMETRLKNEVSINTSSSGLSTVRPRTGLKRIGAGLRWWELDSARITSFEVDTLPKSIHNVIVRDTSLRNHDQDHTYSRNGFVVQSP
jgi:hypothetical protein